MAVQKSALFIVVGMLALSLSWTGCGLEGEIFGAALDQGHVVLPQPKDTVVLGRSTPAAGGAVLFTTGSGTALPERDGAVDEEGAFVVRFGGAEAYIGMVVWTTLGDRMLAGVLPELPRQPSVFFAERQVNSWEPPFGHSSLGDINATTTALAFVASRAAQNAGAGLDALTAATIRGGLDEIVASLGDTSNAVYAFAQLVATIDALAADSSSGVLPFQPAGLAGDGTSLLAGEWLRQVSADLDGDGFADTDTSYFDGLLDAAAAEIAFGVCYAPDEIAVVWHVDLNAGVKNLNCSDVDRFKWASDDPDKVLFLAGGIHEDTPVCSDSVTGACVTQDTVDAVNEAMGGWVPNKTQMYDDGTNGDAVAGDGIWTLHLTLPYLDPAASPDGAGVRVAYKYTFGLPGQGWTNSEEWPGNQRLLELVDLNGDRVVTRYDIFGDEAANKDKVNALKPALGGCGFIQWEAERDPSCAGDSRENQRDTDGDCVPDAWDDPRPVVPITIECP